MKTNWYYSLELWFVLGLLGLNLSFVIARYPPPGDLSEFVQGVFIGLSMAANILAILLLPARLKQPKK